VYESCGVWFSGHCPPYCCVCVKLMHRRRKQKNSHLRPLVARKRWSSRRGTPMWVPWGWAATQDRPYNKRLAYAPFWDRHSTTAGCTNVRWFDLGLKEALPFPGFSSYGGTGRWPGRDAPLRSVIVHDLFAFLLRRPVGERVLTGHPPGVAVA